MRLLPVFLLLLLQAVLVRGDVRLPSYTRSVLPNGLVLNLMPRKDVPLVTVRVVVKGGAESEPAELSGLAAVTAEMLRRGTENRSAEEFSNELDSLGATFDAGSSDQATVVEMEFLSKDFDKGMDLLLDAVTRPSFPEVEAEKALARRVDGAKALKDNPGAAAAQYYRSFFYGPDHPYGRPADELSYARINRKQIADYHDHMYVGQNMIVAVVGDVSPEAASKVREALEMIPEGQSYQWKKVDTQPRNSSRIAIVDKPDATQTYFYIGQPGIPRNHPDRVPLWLVNTLFGGRFTSMLNQELRVDSGLTYGAGSSFDQSHLPGRISISSFTPTETTGKAIDLAVDVLKRLHEKGLTEEQLSSAKAYLKGTYPSERLETSDQLAEILTEIELNDLNRGEVDDLFSRIDAVTVERANEVTRKYYSPENLTFLLLGNAGKFAAEARKYAPEAVELPIQKPGFSAAP